MVAVSGSGTVSRLNVWPGAAAGAALLASAAEVATVLTVVAGVCAGPAGGFCSVCLCAGNLAGPNPIGIPTAVGGAPGVEGDAGGNLPPGLVTLLMMAS